MKPVCLYLAVLCAAASAWGGVIPVRVTGSSVNLRAKPGTKFEVVSQADRDAVLLARTFQTEWVEVLPPPGTHAYVYAPMVRDNLVAVDELNVRSGPGVNYTPIGHLSRDHVVVVTGSFGEDWLEIDAPAECSLWISADYVERTRPVTPPVGPVIKPEPDQVPAPIVTKPAPDTIAPAGAEPDLADSRGHLLPGEVNLVPLAGQGRPGERAGILRKTPLLERRIFRFRLITKEGERVKTRAYLYGNEPQLDRLVGREMTVRGPEFWVREYVESVIIPDEIILKEPMP